MPKSKRVTENRYAGDGDRGDTLFSESTQPVSLVQSVQKAGHLVVTNSWATWVVSGIIFAFICQPDSVVHVLLLLFFLALLLVLRTVAQREGFRDGRAHGYKTGLAEAASNVANGTANAAARLDTLGSKADNA